MFRPQKGIEYTNVNDLSENLLASMMDDARQTGGATVTAPKTTTSTRPKTTTSTRPKTTTSTRPKTTLPTTTLPPTTTAPYTGPLYTDLNLLGTMTEEEITYTESINEYTTAIDRYEGLIQTQSLLSSGSYITYTVSQSDYNTEMNAYNSAVENYSTQYIAYTNSLDISGNTAHNQYSTIEQLSLAKYAENYSTLLSMHIDPGNVYENIMYYSTVTLESELGQYNVLYNWYSSMISTYTHICLDDSNDISTLISTQYNPWLSLMSDHSNELSTAIHLDGLRDIEIINATSTYQHYLDLQEQHTSTNKAYSDAYDSTITSINIQSTTVNTIEGLYNFQSLQSSIINAEAFYSQANSLKNEIANILNLKAQGIDITNYFNNIKSELSLIQKGGAAPTTTGDQLSIIIGTVDALYSKYSTMVTNLTSQQMTAYPDKTSDQIDSYLIQTGFDTILQQYAENVDAKQTAYDLILASTPVINDMISASYLEYSTILSTGVTQENIDDYI